MTTKFPSESRRKYSWWWDSHISPKNSKWLQDNLTDIDAKVKAMIKLIEEDADSFARRAEMYYKKRPELMKLVEEFYRAYRALAERYDNATGELRHAQRTMAAAFPNQVPFPFSDDSPSGSEKGDPQNLDLLHPLRLLLHSDDFGSAESKKGLKQLQEMFGALENSQNSSLGDEKGRDFEGELTLLSDENLNLKDRTSKAENEIEMLRKALEKLQSEKEGVLLQYDESVKNLSDLERELDEARMSSKGLDEEASKAKAEVQKLKELLLRLEVERDAALSKLNEYRERILKLEVDLSLAQKDEDGLTGRAVKAEAKAQYLEEELSDLKSKNNAYYSEYQEGLKKVTDLEKKLSLTEDKVKVLNGRADRAENEVRALNKALDEASEDKEGIVRRYEHCLEKISRLESELSCALEDIKRLNNAMKLKTEKLKCVEEKCGQLESSNHALQLEADHLEKKITIRNEELSKKDEEIEKVHLGLKNEHARFVQAESALQTLRDLHSQAQREQKALAMELKNGLKMLKEMEEKKHGLEEEILQVKDENKILNVSSSSSKIAMENLEGEILKLKEMKERLESELGAQMGQTNTLQKEIHGLNGDIEALNIRYENLIKQIELVGLDPESFESSVRDLLDQNSELRELCDKEKDEKQIFIKKLDDMKQFLDKNAALESSVTALSCELEKSQEKVKALQGEKSSTVDHNSKLRELCDKERDEKQIFVKELDNMKQFLDKNVTLESSLATLSGKFEKSQEKVKALQTEKSNLFDEKAMILSQLQAITETMQKLLERNTFLEDSLSCANIELSSLREKSKSLEELCKLLSNDKANLISEKSTLVVQLGNVGQRLEDLEKRYAELEIRYTGLEKEKESTMSQVVELKTCLDMEKQERASFTLSNETRLTRLEDHVQLLQEETRSRKKEFEEELDRAVNAQFEIFVLQKFIQDMEQKNSSLLLECQKHVEASKLSDKVISELESENLEQQVEAEILLDEIEKLRLGLFQVFKALEVSSNDGLVNQKDNDNLFFDRMVENIEDLKFSLSNYKDDKDQLSIENSILLTLFGQLKFEASELALAKNILEHDYKITYEQLVTEQNEKKKLIELNKQLNSDVKLRDQLTDELKAGIQRLGDEQRKMKMVFLKLQDEYSKKLEENLSLLKTLSDLKEKKNKVEEENSSILVEALALENNLIVFKHFGAEKAEEVKSLSENLQKLDSEKNDLESEVGKLRSELDMKEIQNLLLEKWVQKLEEELFEIREIDTQLTDELSAANIFSNQKEVELLLVLEKLKAKEDVNSQLCRAVEEMKRKSKETELVIENLEKHNLSLSEETKNQKIEIDNLLDFNGSLECEVGMLREEVEERKIREDKLSSELKEISNEFQMYEAEAETFHFDLQISTVREVFLQNKVNELSCVCESLESERDSKLGEIEQMRLTVSSLESEVGGLKDQLIAYDPVIDVLKENVISLEKKILSQQELTITDTGKIEDDKSANDLHEKSIKELMEDDKFVVPHGVSELQQLQNRIKEVEKVVTEEMKRQAKLNTSKANSKLEEAMREIEDLKAKCSLRFEKSKHKEKTYLTPEVSEKVFQKTKPEFFEMKNGMIVTKDIPLDDISHDSLHGVSRRRFQRADDQMLELWETSEDDHSFGRINRKSIKQAIEPVNVSRRFENTEPRSIRSSLDLQVEKELGVDRLEVPTSGAESSTPDRNKRKILERLNSDSQKLKTMQITVEDLRRRIEANAVKKKKAKNVDFETVKEQLEEVEDTIIQLVEVNEKLTKNVEENSAYSDKKASSPELEVIANLRRKRVADQARKGSEKIGRLQIEVQKIQYMLMKLEDEKKSNGKIRLAKSNTSIIFADFISGRRRNSQKKKKPCLCGCFRATGNEEGRISSEFNNLKY